MSEKKYYVFCASNCRYESMTKEQILAAIMQAVESGEIHDVDAGFITRLQEQNAKRAVTIWVGTRAQYNAIAEPAENCLYIITDDTTAEDFDKAIAALQKQAAAFERQHAITDFSEAVTIPDAAGCGFEIERKKFVHDAASGIVHFFLTIRYTAEKTSGSFETIITLGEYSPKSGWVFPLALDEIAQGASVYMNGFIGSSNTVGAPCKLNIMYNTDIYTGDRLYISGWYFV